MWKSRADLSIWIKEERLRMLVCAQWRRKSFFLKVPNNLYPRRRKETAEFHLSGKNHIKFLQGKNHINFLQRQDNRMGGWKRWSKPQVSPLREDSNIILSNTFIATERETSVSLEQILSRNCATWLKDYMECKAPHRWAWRPLILVFSTVTCKTEESVYSLLFYLVPDWKDYHKLRWVFRQSWETETVVQHR